MSAAEQVIGALPRPVALVCAAAERNGAAQIGLLASLSAGDWRPDLVLGSSSGSLLAAAVIKDSAEAIARATHLWRAVADSKMVPPSWARLATAATSSDGVRLGRSWRTLLTDQLGDTAFEPDGSAALVTTDLSTGAAVLLNQGELVDAILAAAAFPVIAPPVITESDIYVDGSFTAPAPVLQAQQLGAASIVLLSAARPAQLTDPPAPNRWYDVVLAAVRGQVSATASHDIAQAAAEMPIVMLSSPVVPGMDWADIDSRVDDGLQAGTSQLEQIATAMETASTDTYPPGLYAVAAELVCDRRLSEVLRPAH